jgi:uncharacterized RDD family membrane protein YckC
LDQIVTGEAVPIDLRVARLGSRMIAAMLDLIMMMVALYLLGVVLVVVFQPDNEPLAAALAIIVYVGVFVGYPVLCETFLRGSTLGKMAMGLRVVRDDGGPIRFRHALVRALVGVVAERPGIFLFIPGVVCMMVSNRSKRLGDLFAGTVVLQESVPRTTGAPPRMPPELASWAAMLDLTKLDDELVFSVRRLLSRAAEMSPEARDAVSANLAAEVRKVVTPAPPYWTNDWAYMHAVLAERTRRAYYRLVARTAPTSVSYGPPPGTWAAQPASYPPAPHYQQAPQYPPQPGPTYPVRR